jgi:hypothetical protein
LVGVLGPAAARRRLESLVAEAQTALEGFGSDAVRAAARFPKAKITLRQGARMVHRNWEE